MGIKIVPKKKKKKGGRAVSNADAKRGGRAVSNADAKRGGRAVSNKDRAPFTNVSMKDADEIFNILNIRDKHKYLYEKGKQSPGTMSDMQMHRAKKSVSKGVEDDPRITKAIPYLKGRKFKRTVETDESGSTAGRISKKFAKNRGGTVSAKKKTAKKKTAKKTWNY